MRSALTIVLATAATALWASHAAATIIGGGITGGSVQAAGGDFNLIAPIPGGFTVGDDNQQTNDLFAFNEDQNILLNTALDVDVGAGPIGPAVIVASHYIFFDPVEADVEGFVLFDAPVLGILTMTDTLFASDVLANTSVTYLNPTLRGLETGDFATIDGGDPNRVNVNFFAASPGDYIRVLTERSPIAALIAIPEPGSIGLFGLSLGLMLLFGGQRAADRRQTA